MGDVVPIGTKWPEDFILLGKKFVLYQESNNYHFYKLEGAKDKLSGIVVTLWRVDHQFLASASALDLRGTYKNKLGKVVAENVSKSIEYLAAELKHTQKQMSLLEM